MQIRFAARGDGADAVIHLTVSQRIHIGEALRLPGDALCRPAAGLPNLEVLLRQQTGQHRFCQGCLRVLAKVRRTKLVNLPAAAAITAAELLRSELQSAPPKPKREPHRALALVDKPYRRPKKRRATAPTSAS